MRKLAATVYFPLLILGLSVMALAPRAARADPSVVSLSSTEGVLGSFVILYGSGFGNAQGQSYVMYGGHFVPAVAWSDVAVSVVLIPQSGDIPLMLGVAQPLMIVKEPGNVRSNPVPYVLLASNTPPPSPGTGGNPGSTGTTG